MTKLQVFKETCWQYVFCNNPRAGIITTENKSKALPGAAIEYFREKYANHIFRVSK